MLRKARVRPMEPASRDSMARLKLIGALVRLDALQPDGFTAQELAENARVELETARSFLKKEPTFAAVVIEAKAPPTGSNGRGRPANLYQLPPGRRADVIKQLAAIRQELDAAEGIAGPSATQLFAPLELLEDTLSELEGSNDAPEEWRDRLEEARLEFASAMADCQALQSRASPEAIRFAKRIDELRDRLTAVERRGPPSSVETAAERGFDIEIERWEKAGHADSAVRITAASLRIAFADKVATRHTAPWLKSVREDASLAAYPLALWFTKSWWRLRWEPAALGLPKPSWRAAHELAFAADRAFEWPPLVMGSLGERLFAVCSPEESSDSGLRYVDSFRTSISAPEFERAVDKFVGQTIARFTGLADSELSVLWKKLVKDRADSHRASYRRFEALLGFNPDEASAELMRAVEDVAAKADPLTVNELVAGLGASGEDPNVLVSKATDAIQSASGIQGRISRVASATTLNDAEAKKMPPWEVGRQLASECRKAFGFGLEPISDEKLGDLLSLTSAQVRGQNLTMGQCLPFGIAIRNVDDNNTKFLFRRSTRVGRRFEAARFLADAHLSSPKNTWILETDTKTDRQKAQRAFAVEFLMPFDSLRDYLGDKFDDELLEKAACYYGTTSIAVQHQLHNNATKAGQATRETHFAHPAQVGVCA